MASINVVLHHSSGKGHSPGSLLLRVIHCRRVKTVTLRQGRIYPEEWNEKEQKIIYPVNNPIRKTFLESMAGKLEYEIALINSYILSLEKNGWYTVDEVIKKYRESNTEGKLLGYTELLIADMHRNGQERTANAYRTVAKGLVRFNKGEDIPLDQLNNTLIRSFENYLKQNNKMPNTVSYYMRNLRAIYNKAVADKRVYPILSRKSLLQMYIQV